MGLWIYVNQWKAELWIVQGKERIARALDGMGCRRTRVVLTELLQRSFRNAKRKRRKTFEFRHLWRPAESSNKFVRFKSRFFSAWGALYDKAKLDQMYRLEHNEQMLKYSQCLGTWINNDRIGQPFVPPRFMLGQKFRKDSKVIIVTVLSFHAISIDFLSLFQSPPSDFYLRSPAKEHLWEQMLCTVSVFCNLEVFLKTTTLKTSWLSGITGRFAFFSPKTVVTALNLVSFRRLSSQRCSLPGTSMAASLRTSCTMTPSRRSDGRRSFASSFFVSCCFPGAIGQCQLGYSAIGAPLCWSPGEK